jgi:hypothetical protein
MTRTGSVREKSFIFLEYHQGSLPILGQIPTASCASSRPTGPEKDPGHPVFTTKSPTGYEYMALPQHQEKGRIPRSASICSQSYLRPAAVKSGAIPEGCAGRFGWHNMRHSLATFLSANDVHLSVTQSILRHKNMRITADVFHSCGQCQTEGSTAEVPDSPRDVGAGG